MKKIRELKARLRKKSEEIINKISPYDARRKSRAICNNLLSLDFYKSARSIMFFIPKKDEPDITYLIKRELGKNPHRKVKRTIYAPKVVGNKIKVGEMKDFKKGLVKGAFGIYEPRNFAGNKSGNAIPDVVIAPARAYDLSGRRLGRGAGYYDRFLKKLPLSTVTIGVVFDECLFNKIPSENKDVPVRVVVTERRVVKVIRNVANSE